MTKPPGIKRDAVFCKSAAAAAAGTEAHEVVMCGEHTHIGELLRPRPLCARKVGTSDKVKNMFACFLLANDVH